MEVKKCLYSEEVWFIYFMGSLYIQSHWINCFEVSFESEFNDFPCIVFSPLFLRYIVDESQDKFCLMQVYTQETSRCLSCWPQWLFQSLSIPPTSSSFSSFPSGNLLLWENTSHQRCRFIPLSTIKSKNLHAFGSPGYSIPLFTREQANPYTCCAGFLTSLLLKNLCHESFPYLTCRQVLIDPFISVIKQAQVSTKLFESPPPLLLYPSSSLYREVNVNSTVS